MACAPFLDSLHAVTGALSPEWEWRSSEKVTASGYGYRDRHHGSCRSGNSMRWNLEDIATCENWVKLQPALDAGAQWRNTEDGPHGQCPLLYLGVLRPLAIQGPVYLRDLPLGYSSLLCWWKPRRGLPRDWFSPLATRRISRLARSGRVGRSGLDWPECPRRVQLGSLDRPTPP